MSKPNSIPFVCRYCGKKGFVWPSQLTAYKGAGSFCSRDCHFAYRRAHPESCVRWKGGKTHDGAGYILQKDPLTRQRTREHRLVVEAGLGRKLEPHEHVHHINGDKADNRLENLEVLSAREHGIRHRDEYRMRFTDDVEALHREGWGSRRIAQELGIGRDTTRRIITQLGLKPHPPGSRGPRSARTAR